MTEYFVYLLLISFISLLFVFGKDVINVSRLPLIFGFCLVLSLVLAASYLARGQSSINTVFDTEKTVKALVQTYLAHDEPQEELLKKLEKIEPKYFIMGLQRYLQKNPSDSSVWITLGNALQSADNKQLSLMAYQRAYRVNPENTELAFAYINAKLSFDSALQLNEPDEEIIRILRHILSTQEHHENALMLLGVAAYQGKDFPLAVDAWSKLRDVFNMREGDSKVPETVMNALDKSIAQAKESALRKQTQEEQLSLQSFRIQVEIGLSETLKIDIKKRLAESETAVLFLYLKPQTEGRAMPLAAVRYPLKGAEFPLSIDISDSNSLSGVNPFSFEQLELSVRISFTGQALPNAGDLESTPSVIKTNPMQESASLLIDKVL